MKNKDKVSELVQPVTSQDQLEIDQSMKEPVVIVANRKHRSSNHQCESSEDKASAGENQGCRFKQILQRRNDYHTNAVQVE